jgi:transposase
MDGEIVLSSRARRQWTREKKLQIVEESFRPDLSVLEVARRHDLDAAQIYQWRKTFGAQKQVLKRRPAPLPEVGGFVAVSVHPDKSEAAMVPPDATSAPPALSDRIEISLADGRRMSVPMSMDADQIGRLVQAVDQA